MTLRAFRLALVAAPVMWCAFLGLTPAKAATVVTWTFQSPSGIVSCTPSCTHDYSQSTYDIFATAFKSTSGSHAWQAEALYDKTSSGDEHGLGINSDTTGDHEIYGSHFIQINVSNAITAGLKYFEFEMGSTTQKEGWRVYGSNSTGTGAALTLLLTGQGDMAWALLPTGYNYYDFFYYNGYGTERGQGNNVLLSEFAGSDCPFVTGCAPPPPPPAVPLPGALPLFVSGGGLLGFLGWRRKRRMVKLDA